MRWWRIGKREEDLDRELRSDLEFEEEERCDRDGTELPRA
jgi:hypothetical protein